MNLLTTLLILAFFLLASYVLMPTIVALSRSEEAAVRRTLVQRDPLVTNCPLHDPPLAVQTAAGSQLRPDSLVREANPADVRLLTVSPRPRP